MARRIKAPLFLKRQSYRRRRLRDAARLLPVAGALLLCLPILWAPGETLTGDTAPDMVYLFSVWIGLIALAAAFAPGLAQGGDDDDPRDEG